MYRKITRTGPATLTISLPAKWTKKNNLSPGEEINVEEKGEELVISPSKKTEKLKSIKFQYKAYLIREMLEKLYYEKYSEIEISSEEPLPNSLQELINNFAGFEIIESQEKKIVIQRVFTSSGQNLGAILRRIYLIFLDNLKNNPPKPDIKIKELLWLLKQENYRLDVIESLLKIYDILRKEEKPFYDEAFSLMRNTFNKVYQQNYNFNTNTAKELSNIFEKQDEMFSYYFKQTKFLEETSKLYSCLELLNQLNKILIKKKSIEELSSLTEGKERKQFRIGMCLKNQSNEFWGVEVVEGMNNALKSLDNIGLDIEFPLTDFDVKGQEKILNAFLLQKFDVIVYAPIDPKASKDILKSINKAKIPLIILDTDIELKGIDYYYLGFDNYKGGYDTGQYLKKKLPKKSSILTLSGHLVGNFSERIKGFRKAIGKNYNIKLIKGEFIGSVAYEEVLSYVEKNKVDAIFAISDNMALGAISALKKVRKKVLVCGFDATKKGRSQLKSGKLLSTVNTKPKKLGNLGIQIARDLISGKDVAERTIYDIELIHK